MAFKYFKPKEVISPKSSIKSVTPLYDGKVDGYSVAQINWQGNECIGIRWNINNNEWNDAEKQNGNKKCLGEPCSRGYPTWFILPNEFLQATIEGKNGDLIEKIKKYLQEANNPKT